MTCRVSPGDGGSATKAARDKGREGSQTSVGTVYVRPASPSRQERDTWSGPATVRPRGGGGLWVCRARQNAFLDLAAPQKGKGRRRGGAAGTRDAARGTRLYSCPSAPRPRSRRRIPFGVGCGDFGVVGTVDAVGAPVAVGVEVGAYVSVQAASLRGISYAREPWKPRLAVEHERTRTA